MENEIISLKEKTNVLNERVELLECENIQLNQ
jgi:hypothetical protein